MLWEYYGSRWTHKTHTYIGDQRREWNSDTNMGLIKQAVNTESLSEVFHSRQHLQVSAFHGPKAKRLCSSPTHTWCMAAGNCTAWESREPTRRPASLDVIGRSQSFLGSLDTALVRLDRIVRAKNQLKRFVWWPGSHLESKKAQVDW
jgi:hypothetical protein